MAKKIQFIRGKCYIGKDIIFYNGDTAEVEDDVADYFLSVEDSKGRRVFKEYQEPDESPSGGGEEAPGLTTIKEYKEALDKLEVPYAPNATLTTVTALYNEAMVNQSEGSDDDDEEVTL